MPRVVSSPVRWSPLDEVVPDLGRHHHAPGAQSHPHRLAQRREQVGESGLPHPVAQVEDVTARDEQDVRLPDPRDPGEPSSMLGSAVSSSTPIDFQPRSTMGFSALPLMNCHARSPGPTEGCPYIAVGMHRALQSAIGLPSSSTSAPRILALVTPPDVEEAHGSSPIRSRGQGWHADLTPARDSSLAERAECIREPAQGPWMAVSGARVTRPQPPAPRPGGASCHCRVVQPDADQARQFHRVAEVHRMCRGCSIRATVRCSGASRATSRMRSGDGRSGSRTPSTARVGTGVCSSRSSDGKRALAEERSPFTGPNFT